ncbi:hypothetical protein [Streptomyces sp. KMM 9044]|nr:hypothetical protein [Streptomyces sp. KMM 9044]WAX77525.1 hypothetical protein HUV60_007465 [Streptomyces sp. KMM 9044]
MTDEELQERLAWAREQIVGMGVLKSPDGLRWAAAHGLVLSVW